MGGDRFPWAGYLFFPGLFMCAMVIEKYWLHSRLLAFGATLFFVIAATVFVFLWFKGKEYLGTTEACAHGVEGAKAKPGLCSVCSFNPMDHERKRLLELEKIKHERRMARETEWEEWKANIRIPEFLKQMDPLDFELLVVKLYELMGYQGELTKRSGDNGIDGFLRKDGELLLLQCKRVKKAVGEPVLRDLYGTVVAQRARGGVLVTTGTVSRQAREWATGKPLRLIELLELTELIKY